MRAAALHPDTAALVAELRAELAHERAERKREAEEARARFDDVMVLLSRLSLAAEGGKNPSNQPSAPAVDPGPTCTVDRLWNEYDHAHRSKSWWKPVASTLRPGVKRFGSHEVTALTRLDWRTYIAEDRAHLLPQSRRQELKRWRAMIRWGREEGLVPANVTHEWERMKLDKRHQRRRTEIESEHLDQIVDSSPDVFAVYMVVVFDCGLRRSEALALQRSWVDWDRKRLRLPAEATKTKVARDVAATDRAIDAIRALPAVVGSPYVFANRSTGEPYTESWASKLFRAKADAIGLEAAPGDRRAHLHDTRGSLAMRLLRAGANVRQLMEQLGWSNIATADEYVQRWSREDDESLRTKLDQAAARKPPKRTGVVVSGSWVPGKINKKAP